MPAETDQDALKKAKVKGRIEMVKVSDDFTLMIDYAHNAMSLESLLTTLKNIIRSVWYAYLDAGETVPETEDLKWEKFQEDWQT